MEAFLLYCILLRALKKRAPERVWPLFSRPPEATYTFVPHACLGEPAPAFCLSWPAETK